MRQILWLTIFFSSYALAQDKACIDRVLGSMQSTSEQYLLATHPNVIEQFLSVCDKTSYGDTALLSGIVLVHEAAHFEDLGFNNNNQVNLYSASAKHLGALTGTTDLPRVDKTNNPILERDLAEALNDEESYFMGMHSGYLMDNESLAADSIVGLATELNGYTHGLKYEARVKQNFPETAKLNIEGTEYVVPNPYKNFQQIDGIYYFLYNFNLYLNELKKKHPEKLKMFLTNANKTLLRELFHESIEVLSAVKHCQLPEREESALAWRKLLSDEDLAGLELVLSVEDKARLTCADPKEILKQITSPQSCDE